MIRERDQAKRAKSNVSAILDPKRNRAPNVSSTTSAADAEEMEVLKANLQAEDSHKPPHEIIQVLIPIDM